MQVRWVWAVLVLGVGLVSAQDAAPPRPNGPVRISGGVIAGSILTKVNPVYPVEAKEKGIEGAVVLHALIAKDGLVESLAVISGNALLAQAAIDAVKQWTYKPYLLNGEPTEVDTTITVNFSLGSGATGIAPDELQAIRLTTVPPVYPMRAKENHVTGSVVLAVRVGTDGHLTILSVISGPDLLRDSAVECVRQWKYKPYLVNGVPVAVESTVTVNYRMG